MTKPMDDRTDKPPPQPAPPDEPTAEQKFDRFAALARRLVSVPKSAVDVAGKGRSRSEGHRPA